MSFTDKIVLITGAGSGIGADAARHLSKLGATVVLAGRDAAKMDGVAHEIFESGGCHPLQIEADVTQDAERIIAETIKKFGKLDVLVNNAGIIEFGTLETTTLDAFDRILNTNLRSAFHLSKLAAPHLIAAKGNIVNVSSLMGIRAFTNILAYCTSKAALNQLTQCMALELAPKGVRVNSVNPGVVRTPLFQTVGMSDRAVDHFEEQAKACYPLGRIGRVQDTSSAIEFLAGESSSFITGLLLSVDGGISLGCPRVLE